MFSGSHSQVEGCTAEVVLGIDLAAPRLEVIARCVRSRKARPMQRSTAFRVFRVNVNAFLPKVSQTESLVTLGCHMHHVDPLLVFDSEVGPIFDQELDQLSIPVETGVV